MTIKAEILGVGPNAVESETRFDVVLANGCKVRLYAANEGKWNVAMPPAKGSRWAAGLRQFPSHEAAVEFLTALDESGKVPTVR